MQFSFPSGIVAVLAVVLCQSAFGQDARGAKGIPPRIAPAEYQAHAQAGTVTIGAEFDGHSVPTPQATFSTEDYMVVEVGLFGPPEARLKLSYEDFSLRIDGKKAALPAQQFGLVFTSLKDPEWAPPVPPPSKSKGGLNTGGNGQGEGDPPPPVVHMPMELVRAMEQKVQNAALPEGDRVLPQAGLIFFKRGGKTTGFHSVELIYEGPAGKAIVALQP